MAPFTIVHYFSVFRAFTKKKKKKKKKEVIVPFERYWSFNSERHQKLLSLSLSPDSLSRVKKWQRCWRLLLKRLIKDVQLEGNLKIFSSQVKLSFEFTNSLLQLTNNHTSTSLLSVACTGLFFLFFSVAYRGCHNDNIVSLRAVLRFRRRPKSVQKKRWKVDIRTPHGFQLAPCSILKSKFFH